MQMRMTLIGSGLAVALSCAAPAQAFVFNTPNPEVFSHPFGSLYDTRTKPGREVDSTRFNQALYDAYTELSDDRGNAWFSTGADFRDAELFKHKARSAGRDSNAIPESPLDRHLDAGQQDVFWAALGRLRIGFEHGGRIEAPAAAARAQVGYDCWIEAVEDGRGEDAERCQTAFETAMNEVEFAANYGLSDAGYGVASADAAFDPGSILVYFDFDKAEFLPDGELTILDVKDLALARSGATVRLVGHADRAGTVAYNQVLSERRANAVIEALIAAGVDRSQIVSEAVGEMLPLVPTLDGIKEPGNRVVEIGFD